MPFIRKKQDDVQFHERLSWLKTAKEKGQHHAFLTEELCEKFCELIRQGAYIEIAAIALGIDPQNVYHWLALGNEVLNPDPLYQAFYRAVKSAEAEKEIRALNSLIVMGEGGSVATEKIMTDPDGTVVRDVTYRPAQWQALAWFLERKYPQRYGKITRIEASVNVKTMSDAGIDAKVIDILSSIVPKKLNPARS
jgi:hypothetical protein